MKSPSNARTTTVKPAVAGIFPLDERWRLGPSQYSDRLSRQLVWLSGLLPYGQVVQVLERVGQRQIPQSNVWREVPHHGARLQQAAEQQRARVAPERVVLADEREDHATPKGVSMDGGMIHIRGEGWKEFKVGVVYDVGLRTGQDSQTGEQVDLPCVKQTRYTAVLGDVKQFTPALWALAVGADIPRAAQSSVTADGAEWIWNLTADLFPDSTQIVDWYHALQHLAEAAHALFPDDVARAVDWFRRMQTPLFRGALWRITRPLHHAGLPKHARYFEHHQRRMQYQEFREEGWLIGSGPVESGVKQFKARLTGPGMRWTRLHAARMLVIRSAVLGDSFDDLWAAA